jgi:hypothetical protein
LPQNSKILARNSNFWRETQKFWCGIQTFRTKSSEMERYGLPVISRFRKKMHPVDLRVSMAVA